MTLPDLLDVLADVPDGLAALRDLVLRRALRLDTPTCPEDHVPRARADTTCPEDHVTDTTHTATPPEDHIPRAPADTTCPPGAPVDAALPPGWRRLPLRDLGRWGSGGTPRAPSTAPGPTLPWLKIGDLDGDLVTAAAAHLGEPDLGADGLRRIPPGAVLVAMYGTIGKSAITGVACCTNQAIAHCVPDPALVTSAYLLLLLRALRPALARLGRGAMQQNINQARLHRVVVPLPPLAEQRAILADVHALLARLDACAARRDAADAARRAARDAALAALARGPHPADRRLDRLDELLTTPDDVADLRRALVQAAVRGRLGAPPHDLVEHPGAPYPVPRGWTWQPLADRFEVTGGARVSPSRTPGSVPYLRVANVRRGRLDLADVQTLAVDPGELARWRLVPGDLLIVAGNGSDGELGRCASWSGAIDPCVHQNHLIRARPRRAGDERFAAHYLNSPDGAAAVRALAVTTSGLYSLGLARLRRLPLPVPPPAEQDRILTLLEALLARCDALDAALAAARDLRSRHAAAALARLDRPAATHA